MSQAQREAWAALFLEDVDVMAAMVSAACIDAAAWIAAEYGIQATAEDFARPETSRTLEATPPATWRA